MRNPVFLIIDADPGHRRELGKLLTNLGGQADQPENPEVARCCFNSKDYDCVLVDRDVPPLWRAEVEEAVGADSRGNAPLLLFTGPEDSLPSHGELITNVADGYIRRDGDSTRLLTEHVRKAIGKIRAGIVEKKTISSRRNAVDPVQPSMEHFADSRIIVQTGRIAAPGPVEDIVRVCDRGKDRYAILLGDCTSSDGVSVLSHLHLKPRLDMHMAESHCPSQMLSDLNSELCAMGDTLDFMTAVAVFVDIGSRKLTYSIAGHHPPLHRRWGGSSWRTLTGQGIPMGIRSGEKYQEWSRPLGPGDKVLLISDGFLKIRGAAGNFKDGTSALQRIDMLPSDAAPSEVMEGIHELVETVSGGKAVADEITATLIQV
jgi:hypothetical protein